MSQRIGRRLAMGFVLLWACLVVGSRSQAAPPLDWTVLLYWNADGGGAEAEILADFSRLGSLRSNDRVHLLCLMDRADSGADMAPVTPGGLGWKSGQGSQLVYLAAEGPRVLDSSERDMCSAKEISKALRECFFAPEHRSAHRALLIYGHAAGWEGWLPDYHGSAGGLFAKELADAILAGRPENEPQLHLDLLGLEACCGAQYDALRFLAPTADFLLASEATAMAGSWHHEEVLETLLASSGPMSGRALAERYLACYRFNRPFRTEQLSVGTLGLYCSAALPQLVASVEGLATSIVSAPRTALDAMFAARAKAERYRLRDCQPRMVLENPDDSICVQSNWYVDLREVADSLGQDPRSTPAMKERAHEVVQSMDHVVLANRRGVDYPRGGGIAMEVKGRPPGAKEPYLGRGGPRDGWSAVLSLLFGAPALTSVPPAAVGKEALQQRETQLDKDSPHRFELKEVPPRGTYHRVLFTLERRWGYPRRMGGFPIEPSTGSPGQGGSSGQAGITFDWDGKWPALQPPHGETRAYPLLLPLTEVSPVPGRTGAFIAKCPVVLIPKSGVSSAPPQVIWTVFLQKETRSWAGSILYEQRGALGDQRLSSWGTLPRKDSEYLVFPVPTGDEIQPPILPGPTEPSDFAEINAEIGGIDWRQFSVEDPGTAMALRKLRKQVGYRIANEGEPGVIGGGGLHRGRWTAVFQFEGAGGEPEVAIPGEDFRIR